MNHSILTPPQRQVEPPACAEPFLGGWELVNIGQVQHVSPLYDWRPHEAREMSDDRGDERDGGCWCHPTIDGDMVVHNSMDGRERHESGEVGLH